MIASKIMEANSNPLGHHKHHNSQAKKQYNYPPQIAQDGPIISSDHNKNIHQS
jgi:hypothetical protein